MSVVTHDRQRDHHGSDLDSNVNLDGDVGATASGSSVHQALLDLQVAASNGGPVPLISGDSSTFASSYGSWGHTGGTLSYDAGMAFGSAGGSAKLVVTSSGSIDLAIGGTFKAGKLYWLVFWLATDTNIALAPSLGVPPTDFGSGTMTVPALSSPSWVAYAIPWRPTADRTGVTASVYASSAGTMWLGAAQLVQSELAPSLLFDRGGGEFCVANPLVLKGSGSWGTRYGTGTAGVRITPSGVTLADLSNLGGVTVASWGVYVWAEQAAGDRVGAGFNIEVGPHYVGLYISEKDDHTIQFYGDYMPSSPYDFEFVDDDETHHWRHVASDGGQGIPSLGMLPKYASAPTSPVEGQSYYDTVLKKNRTWDGTQWNNWW